MNLILHAMQHPRAAGFQASPIHDLPPSGTFSARFCDDHHCRRDAFVAAVLRLCVARRALPILLLMPNSRFFGADRELIQTVERASTMEEVQDDIDYYWSQPANKTWLRRVVGLRLSTSRLRRVAGEYLPFAKPRRARRP